MEQSSKLRKSEAFEVTQKQQAQLARWNRFLESEAGCYPASLAAICLRMTSQGVYQAAQRGWIVFFQVGRNRWYGKKSVHFYRDSVSRKFPSNRPLPFPGPRKVS
jgi:hypothetical protein